MSEEKEIQNEEVQEETKEQENQEIEHTENAEEAVEEKEPTWEERFNELNNKYLRIHAEFDNYRKRTNKEKLEIINTANSGMMKDLLPVLDDFERAMENNEKVEDLTAVKEGFQLIYNKLKNNLGSKGLKEMEVTGEVFDSEIHEAIANIPAPSKKLKGKVVEAVEKGYYLNERVIRFAKVVVGQ